MKNIALFCVMLLLVGGVYGQEKKASNIPEAAIKAFASKFSEAKKAKWSLEKSGEYEVEFILAGAECSAVYDGKGNLVESETELEEKDLPASIRDYIAKDYSGFMLGEISKTVNGKGVQTFEVEVSKNKQSLELVFDANGKFLKKTEEKGNDEDGD